MKFPMFFNKGLLWKEWKQNGFKCWAAFVLMSLTPIISPILAYFIGMVEPGIRQGMPMSVFWLQEMLQMVSGDQAQSSMGMMAVWVVLAFGVVILAEERGQNTLKYLAGMPINRQEIISAKMTMGTQAILGIMLVNLLFIVVYGYSQSVPDMIPAALAWFAVTTSVLLAIFALALLAAVVTGNLAASLVLAIALVFGPKVIMGLFYLLLESFGVIITEASASGPAAFLLYLGRVLTLPEYLKSYQYGQTSLVVVPALLAASGAFFALAVRAFEGIHLERQGKALMVNNSRAIIWVTGSLLAAALVSILGVQSGVLERGAVAAAVFAAICLLSAALFSRLGSKPSN